jgi:NMD protein affecting ribosome stability and mRNA decay
VARFHQKTLFCRHCGALPEISGLCATCYRQYQHSLRSFAGLRDQVLARDGYICQGCGAGNQRSVHHRRPGIHDGQWLITLCPACHAVIHKLLAHRRWLPGRLVELWHEQHRHVPLQFQLPIERGREAGAP